MVPVGRVTANSQLTLSESVWVMTDDRNISETGIASVPLKNTSIGLWPVKGDSSEQVTGTLYTLPDVWDNFFSPACLA